VSLIGCLRRGVAAALVLSTSMAAVACGRARSMPAPGIGAPALRVLVFYDDRAEKPRGTILPLIAANRSAIWELAPLWYKVLADGSVRDLSENDVKQFARKNGIQLMPLVINNEGTSAFLLGAGNCSAGPCARAVSQLASIVQREQYDGLNIDFEQLQDQARSGLTAFVSQLHSRLRAMGKTLTVDVIPAGSRRQAEHAYDFPGLARASDDVVLMAYDAHDDGSAPGPIAPLAWVRHRVNVALSLGVPRDKLVLGLADYGYDWTAPGHATTIGLKDAQALASRLGVKVQRTRDGSPHFTYRQGNTTHTVWYEDGRAILPKVELARTDRLKALALWMAGYETPEYWHALRAAAGTLTTVGAFASGAGASSSAPAAPSGPSGSRSGAAPGTASSASSATVPSRSGAGASSSSSGGSAAGSGVVPAR
jgi:spore germination protein YaaH